MTVSIENYLIALHSYCVDCDSYFRNPDRFTASFDNDANDLAYQDWVSAQNQGIYFGSDLPLKERFTKLLIIASLRYECLRGRFCISANYQFAEDAIVSYRHGGQLFGIHPVD